MKEHPKINNLPRKVHAYYKVLIVKQI